MQVARGWTTIGLAFTVSMVVTPLPLLVVLSGTLDLVIDVLARRETAS